MIRATLFFLFLSAFFTVQAQPMLELDRIETVRLDDEGKATIRVNVPRTGVIRADVFSALDSVGEVSVAFEQEAAPEGEAQPAPTPVNLRAVDKGRHRLIVTSTGASKGDVQLRLMLEPALDLYEPNDTMDTAYVVEPPLLGLMQITGQDEDWFRVDVPRGHYIGVQITGNSYSGQRPRIAFVNRRGEELVENGEQNVHRAMYYFRSEGGPVYIRITDLYGWAPGDPRAFATMKIESYAPNRESANLFVKVDMGSDELTSTQTDYLAEASGTRVSDVEEAAEFSEELSRAVRRPTDNGPGFWVWALGVIILGLGVGGGYAFWKRRQQGAGLPEDTAEEKTDAENPAPSPDVPSADDTQSGLTSAPDDPDKPSGQS